MSGQERTSDVFWCAVEQSSSQMNHEFHCTGQMAGWVYSSVFMSSDDFIVLSFFSHLEEERYCDVERVGTKVPDSSKFPAFHFLHTHQTCSTLRIFNSCCSPEGWEFKPKHSAAQLYPVSTASRFWMKGQLNDK